MRVRKRYAVMLAIAALIGGVVIFQAVTATPPEPYVRLAGRLPPPPVLQFECRDGEAWAVYTRGDGTQFEPVPTGDPCGSRGWDANGDFLRRDEPTPEQ